MDVHFHVHHGVAERIERRLRRSLLGERFHRAFFGHRLRARAEDVRRHDIKLRGFIDGFDGVLLKQRSPQAIRLSR